MEDPTLFDRLIESGTHWIILGGAVVAAWMKLWPVAKRVVAPWFHGPRNARRLSALEERVDGLEGKDEATHARIDQENEGLMKAFGALLDERLKEGRAAMLTELEPRFDALSERLRTHEENCKTERGERRENFGIVFERLDDVGKRLGRVEGRVGAAQD